ncbi:MAG: glutamine amidotransferase-related protein, partial [Cyanobacteriota bacterium]
LTPGSLAQRLYGEEVVYERHRHRYEFNNAYRGLFVDGGYAIGGTSPEGRLVELIELPRHPFFAAGQFHPEFLSRPGKPHPLFRGLIEAAQRHHPKSEASERRQPNSAGTTAGEDSAEPTPLAVTP